MRADTKLIRDALRNFKEQYNRDTLTIEFPLILRNLQGTDAKIEIFQSNMLQPTLVPIRGNRPTRRKAYVLIN